MSWPIGIGSPSRDPEKIFDICSLAPFRSPGSIPFIVARIRSSALEPQNRILSNRRNSFPVSKSVTASERTVAKSLESVRRAERNRRFLERASATSAYPLSPLAPLLRSIRCPFFPLRCRSPLGLRSGSRSARTWDRGRRMCENV